VKIGHGGFLKINKIPLVRIKNQKEKHNEKHNDSGDNDGDSKHK
jgi:hypothetical protein